MPDMSIAADDELDLDVAVRLMVMSTCQVQALIDDGGIAARATDRGVRIVGADLLLGPFGDANCRMYEYLSFDPTGTRSLGRRGRFVLLRHATSATRTPSSSCRPG